MANVTGRIEDLGPEIAVAATVVKDAIRLARAVERDVAAGALTKADASPVTIADFAVQALVAARLARECPDTVVVAEEDAGALRGPGSTALLQRVVDSLRRVDPGLAPSSVIEWIDRGAGEPGKRFWTLDPIDGTKGLVRGGQYVVALALVEDGTVQLGVLGCPRLSAGGHDAALAADRAGGIAVAARGRGSWWASLDGGGCTRLSVSLTADPAHCRVLHSFEAAHSDVARLEHVLTVLGAESAPILMDSQAKHVVLARGGADVLLRFPTDAWAHDAIWDQAAGSLLIEEAGGRVTDIDGRVLDFSTGRRLQRNHGVLASNGRLHEAVLAALR